MSEYTPTQFAVEDAWHRRFNSAAHYATPKEKLGYQAEFDRWLASVKADAWDEGQDAGWLNYRTSSAPVIANPYRGEQA